MDPHAELDVILLRDETARSFVKAADTIVTDQLIAADGELTAEGERMYELIDGVLGVVARTVDAGVAAILKGQGISPS